MFVLTDDADTCRDHTAQSAYGFSGLTVSNRMLGWVLCVKPAW